jgi:DEAD/DEAH box helicase domain-containing protein
MDVQAIAPQAEAHPLDVEALLARLGERLHVARGGQIVHTERLALQQPRYAQPSPPLPTSLQRALDLMDIPDLYTHQVEALERVRQGENVVVVTSTSSGKTLCYNLPVIEHILRDREARALYIYPINALVNDQLKGLFKINLALGQEAVGVARYTGSLSADKRKAARARNPSIWLTNPEMLHLSFLLWHQNWEDLWRNLRYVVVDEVHTYRGVFGSNMAHLFRRVQRMAAHYGSSPQFIGCSATIANPRELAETLVGRPFSVVDRDGAGRGRKHFVLWNPPLRADTQDNLRRPYAEEAVDLLLECVRADYNTICFARARGQTERMLRMAQREAATVSNQDAGAEGRGVWPYAPNAEALPDRTVDAASSAPTANGVPAGDISSAPTTDGVPVGAVSSAPTSDAAEPATPLLSQADQRLLKQISSYRAGYLADEREEIEAKLKAGDIRGIITTNALEMGIDIGGLDAAIIAGYPGTIMSTWQQAGRAGRRGRDALVVLVASQNPLDQYYINHPREFFARPHELAVVDLNNQYIRLKHLLCAARELPVTEEELLRLDGETRALVQELCRLELLQPVSAEEGAPRAWAYPKQGREVHFQTSLRSASQDIYTILDENRNEVGTIEPPNVFREAHPGAIYQHGGDDYRVSYLDRQRKTVSVREERSGHYTRALSTLNVRVEQVYATRDVQLGGVAFQVALGDVRVEESIRGYQELRLGSEEMIKRVNLDHPLTLRLHTNAMWVMVPAAVREALAPTAPAASEVTTEGGAESDLPDPFASGLHATQHLLTGVMPLLVMCDRRDIDGFQHVAHPDLGAPAVFLYDAYEGGIGLAEVAYQQAERLLRLAYDTVTGCTCQAGCPSCIQSGTCRMHNENLDKAAAIAILGALVGQAASCVGQGDPGEVADGVAPGEATTEGALTVAGFASSQQRALQDLLERTRRRDIYARVAAEAESAVPAQPQYRAGERVEHTSYGKGVVVSTRMEGGHEVVTVRFSQRNMVREIDPSKVALHRAERPATPNGEDEGQPK